MVSVGCAVSFVPIWNRAECSPVLGAVKRTLITADCPGASEVGTLPRFGSEKFDASWVPTDGSLTILKLVRFSPVVPALVTMTDCVWLGPAPALPGATELNAT